MKSFCMLMPILIVVLSLVSVSTMFFAGKVTAAKDFGIEGHTFPIIEEDILKVIEKRLAKVDIKKLNTELKQKTKDYVERPTAVLDITKAKENKSFYFDPSYTVPENIYDHHGLLLHQAGKVINPLEYVPLSEALIFIDGDDEEQVEFALDLRKQKQNKAKIILVKGSPLAIQRKAKVWIYFDQAGFITKKLGNNEVPALVEQDGLRLKISVIGENSENRKNEESKESKDKQKGGKHE